jgi:hypothetical protein
MTAKGHLLAIEPDRHVAMGYKPLLALRKNIWPKGPLQWLYCSVAPSLAFGPSAVRLLTKLNVQLRPSS